MATRTTMGLGALLLAAGALIGAPVANADSASFNNFLAREGIDASSVDTQLANTDLGLAVCNMLNVSQSPTAAMDLLVGTGNHTEANANYWLIASVLELCPELNYLTHYVTAAQPAPRYIPPLPVLSPSEQYQLQYPAFTNGPILDP